ncbi:MAG: guanylate kinase [Gemmatimonadota bacterium]
MTERASPVVLAAPSGTGKTTLAHRLVDERGRYTFSVSATTRAPRGTERNGIDYHFLSHDAFLRMIERGELVEWAAVHGRMYGTPKAVLDEAAAQGRHVLLDIDVQGARQVRAAVPDAKLIFVLPPSIESLMRRLRDRGTEAPQEVARRLRSALDELRAAEDFDYVVVNDDLDRCLAEIEGIVDGRVPADETSGSRADARALRADVARVLADQYGQAGQDDD